MITLRKAMAVSTAVLLLGLVGSLLVYVGLSVVQSFDGWAIPSYYLKQNFNRAIGYCAMAALPGLIGLTVTGCCYVVQMIAQPERR